MESVLITIVFIIGATPYLLTVFITCVWSMVMKIFLLYGKCSD